MNFISNQIKQLNLISERQLTKRAEKEINLLIAYVNNSTQWKEYANLNDAIIEFNLSIVRFNYKVERSDKISISNLKKLIKQGMTAVTYHLSLIELNNNTVINNYYIELYAILDLSNFSWSVKFSCFPKIKKVEQLVIK